MYSSLSDSAKVDAEYAAAGYEVEDWANNNLGTARGWWTRGYDRDGADSDEEVREALKKTLRHLSGAAAVQRGLPELRLLCGALRRATKAEDDARVADVLTALEKHAMTEESLRATSLPRDVGRLRRANDAETKRLASSCVDKWKRIARRAAPPADDAALTSTNDAAPDVAADAASAAADGERRAGARL
ncbi:hypothetical protein M885DRAFT_548493 [Pelagophyceae sp. CCMP2097]|nr:hypothetical protein M885DRAFT_548493 [Pelagophyceae sp. CCMP2097]